MPKNTGKIVFSTIYLLTLLILFIDSVGSNNTILKYFSISSRSIGIFFLLALVVTRFIKNKLPLIPLFMVSNLYVSIITLITSVMLTIVDYVSVPNTVFAATKVQYVQLFYIGIVTGIISLLGKSDEWFTKNYPKLIYIAAPVFFLIGLIISLFPFDVFQQLSKEDSVIESLQVVALMISMLLSLFLTYTLCIRKHYFHAFVYSFVTVILFTVIGDEVAWGQRFLHITTPYLLIQYNTQQELTLHNLRSVNTFISFGYIILGLFGSIAWVVQKLFSTSRRKFLYGFIPPWFTLGFFVIGGIYNIYINQGDHTVGNWSEYMELSLYLGVMFTFIHFYQTRHLFWQRHHTTFSD